MKRQRLLLVNQIMEVFLLLLPVVSGPDEAQPQEGRFHGVAHGQHGVFLPEPEDEVDGRRLDPLERPQVTPDVAQVPGREELQADRLVLRWRCSRKSLMKIDSSRASWFPSKTSWISLTELIRTSFQSRRRSSGGGIAGPPPPRS